MVTIAQHLFKENKKAACPVQLLEQNSNPPRFVEPGRSRWRLQSVGQATYQPAAAGPAPDGRCHGADGADGGAAGAVG